MGADAILVGGILAGSFIIGTVATNIAGEFNTRMLSVVIPAHQEVNIISGDAWVPSGGEVFADIKDAWIAGWQKSGGDFSGLAALLDPYGVFSSHISDLARTLFGRQETQQTANGNFTPPLMPTPLIAGQQKAPSPVVVRGGSDVARIREIIEQRIIPADLSSVKTDILASVGVMNTALRTYMQSELSRLSSSVSHASSQAGSSLQMVTISQDIDNLLSPTVRKGMTIASGGLAVTDGNVDVASGDVIATNFSARQNLTASGDLIIGGGDITLTKISTTTIPDLAINAFSFATSTTAIPLLTFDTMNYRAGVGTTSPGGTFAIAGNVVSSGAATSTFANSLDISSGCFAIGGACVAGGPLGTVIAGTPNRLAYYSAANKIDSASFLVVDGASSFLGIGTTTPGSILSVQGAANFVSSGTSTVYTGLSFPALNATSTTASSTFGGAVQLGAGGIFSSNGLTLSSGSILNTSSATSTFTNSGLSVVGGGFASSRGVTITGGNVLSTVAGSSTVLTGSLRTAVLDVTSQTATSTFGNGLQLFAGCFRMANGDCAITGATGGTFNAGTPNRLAYYSAANVIDSANNITFDGTNLGIGTTTPGSVLSVQGNSLMSGTTTTGSLIATSTLFVGGTTGSSLVILNNGNVGIGTTTPGTMFSVQGIGNFASAATSTLYTDLSLRSLSATSTLYLADGATALPALSFAADTNTGIFRAGVDLLAFSTGGSERVRVDNNGNVGIGTPSPRTILDMTGDLTISGNDINLGTGTATSTISGGFGIGVGTTTPGAAFAVATTTAGLNTAFLLSNLGSGYTMWAEDIANDTSPFVIDGAGNVGVGTTSPGALLSVNAPAGQTSFAIGSSSKTSFLVDKNGNVGIGSLSPGSRLHVGSSTFAALPGSITPMVFAGESGNSIPAYALYVPDGTNNRRAAFFMDQTNGVYGVDQTYTTGAMNFVIRDSANEYLRVDTAGNVGIGTTTPTSLLHAVGSGAALSVTGVNGVGNIGGAQLTAVGASPISARLAFGTDGTAVGLRIAQNNGGTVTDLMTVMTGGNVGIGTTSPGTLLGVHGAGLFSSNLTVGGTLTATSTVLLATASGNVGIGTTSPGTLLGVHGA
ncbi:MAG: hypothetical protein HYT41_00950, partial [Candidatus Sungbacteria bacterium]|nr:hypothetical protein [Candidatus Sungbacteria bacterium]